MSEKLAILPEEADAWLADDASRADFCERQLQRLEFLAGVEEWAWSNFAESGDAMDLVDALNALGERARAWGFYLTHTNGTNLEN
jgi:hypothetical protein